MRGGGLAHATCYRRGGTAGPEQLWAEPRGLPVVQAVWYKGAGRIATAARQNFSSRPFPLVCQLPRLLTGMDTLTHAAVGAAIGEAVLGRRLGAKAAGWGAVLGASPDVDYFVALAFSDAAQLSIHRTYTHSLLALVVVTLVAGWAFKRRYGDAGVAFRHGAALGGGIWGSHVLIDAMTSYGVQLLVPFSDTPVALYTIAILDPLVTLPVAVGVLGALRLPRLAARRRWWNAAGLMLAGAYLAWALIAQQRAHTAFNAMLQAEGITAERSFVKPTLLNTLLWRGLAETDTAYVHGFYSLLDARPDAPLTMTPKHHARIADVQEAEAIRRLLRNMQHYYTVTLDADSTRYIADMRFGRASEWAETRSPYVFKFEVVAPEGEAPTIQQVQRSFSEAADRPDLREMWERMRGRP